MAKPVLTLYLLVIIAICSSYAVAQAADPWEETIRKFEAADVKSPPPKGAVLFVGSSSIVGWDLRKFFPDLVTINRGFGGSKISDSLRYADRIVTPYEPRAIVFYAGDNDIAGGKSPEQVAGDFREFVAKVREKLPDVPILYIGIKPSKKRWHLIDKIREANKQIEASCGEAQKVTFISVEKPMLGEDGEPHADLLKADGLHLQPAGYQIWSDLVRKHLPLQP